ncbi:zinc transporter ZIP9-A isoform X2 [Leguminivora glycinivorella]|uniref:zinc transporter ZIP9-A isoform X1 n=1 Tax=Leguminivora glycinivorella TaxID=1035111 RepID=UPI00200C258F|nr:zinc transporter ZIP9-A isoform X1 [Leguminivora glycinivorella]XP_048004111.1 zinc transporter ZIP9-A isoform X2 [Leguminivora glycinivorella]
MDGTWVLILLALVMLVGSYVAGSIPLNVTMSEDKLKKVTVFGAGLLVGTALAVIIPEGVRSLFSEHSAPTVVTKDFTAQPPAHEDKDLHSVIGITLVLGFVFMLLVDQMSSRYNDSGNPQERNMTATVGLVVHAAADGVALGAAATTSHRDVEIIVFLAIMLHKAPAAFGLVTFLLHAGLDRNRIRKHLLIFSCAAPLLALLTYFGIGNESKQTLNDFNATGIAMLFSAGTFLYVATVHVLPELTHSSHTHALLGEAPKGFGGLQLCEVLILTVGALLPALLTMGHEH